MPAAASNANLTSCFVFRSSFFFLRNDRKSPPWHELHHNVYRLSLCADTYQLHNIWVIILF
uniref:Uncharacterized protein n=1 Tax=Anguilla anguilla TaxID=7936 RepID=A0A0E9U7E3_ANGAN